MRRAGRLAVAAGVWLLSTEAVRAARSAETRCLAMIAYAEAAVDGEAAMAAVIRVVRNRVAHRDFPDDACAVARQRGQFQPVGEEARLRRALADPEGYNPYQIMGATSPYARAMLRAALRLARAPAAGPDPTGGALFFVNPDLMDPARCPWFAALRPTAAIGGHIFLTEYAPGEVPQGPALACGGSGASRVATRRGALWAETGDVAPKPLLRE